MRSVFFVLIVSCLCMADMDLVLLKEAAVNKGAVCIDGTPAGYFFKAGGKTNSSKWVMHLLGGGFCLNLEECLMRSQTNLGSTLYWPSTFSSGGPLNENPWMNPDFYDWNHVFFIYCDGASFSGDVQEPVNYKGKLLYFRGHRNLLATMEDLLKNKGLDKATDVLLVGNSAGGMASFFHADEIRDLLPKSVTRYKVSPLSGVFLDRPNVEGKDVFAGVLKNVFELQNCSYGINPRCIAAMTPENRYKCMFAEYIMDYIESPLFLIGSAYDMIGTACIVGGEPETGPTQTGAGNCMAVPGWLLCESDPSQCTPEQWQKIEEYGNSFIDTIENNKKINQNGNGMFEYNCHTHSVEYTNAWVLYSVKGTSMRDSLRNWFFSDNEPFAKHFYKDCVNHGNYLCNPTCSLPINANKNHFS